MTTNIKPHRERIAVKRIDHTNEGKTSSGLILPTSDKENLEQGTVIAVGTGYLNADGSTTPLSIKVGERVFFGKWSGTEVNVDNEKIVIVKDSDIVASIEA